MLKKVLIGIVAILVVFAIVVALQPSSFRVERSVTIAAPPAKVFAQVNDFHAWTGWSPWENRDPAMKRTYEGPAAGNGSIYKWSSDNNDVGTGMMTITDSRPNELIKINLEFKKPFEGNNTAEFSFKPANDSTTVVWSMYGPNCFIAKAFGLFMNMDKMIGGEFDKGLANLKTQVENNKTKVSLK